MALLITGSSGFLGRQLVAALQATASEARPDVVCLSRRGDAGTVRGSFDRFEDLRGLDAVEIEAVVHLAAAVGGSSEEDALATNLMGTRRLYRYLLDRGCRKFVTASSIAAAGGLSRDFRPLALPLPDEHPCLASDPYGFSKAVVEQLTWFFHRCHPDADFVNLRFGAVVTDDWRVTDSEPVHQMTIPFVQLGRVFASDVVAALRSVVAAPHRPGVRTCNVVGADISAQDTTVEALRRVLGGDAARYDLGHYARPGRDRDPLYRMDRLEREFGFRPARRFSEA